MDRVTECIERACNRAGVPADEIKRKTRNEANKTEDVDTLASTAARHAMYLATDNIGYEHVARDLYLLIVSLTASTTLEDVIQRVGPDTVSDDYIKFVATHRDKLANLLAQGAACERDRLFKTPGLIVIMRSYMLKDRTTGALAESPQLMWMRVAIGVSETIEDVEENYTMLSTHLFTHASPTLFNAGKKRCQMSSCFVIECSRDIEGFLKAQYQAGTISRHAGGIGMAVHGTSHKGKVMPILQAFEKTMHLAEQNSGSRNGRMCVYAEPQAAYVYSEMLNAHKNSGADTDKAHDTFTALWVSDEFMRRVESEQQWTLIDDDAYLIELSHLHGEPFETRYREMEQETRFKKVSAVEYFHRILATQVETGRPFLLYKDHANRKSNHRHLGTIRGSNLCTEIIQYFDEEHTAVCNLASLVLFRFIDADGRFDFGKLRTSVHRLVKNMNVIIDRNYYPTDESRNSNLHTRAIGLGVQGLADVFITMGYPWDSTQAAQLDRRIFETIYFAALEVRSQTLSSAPRFTLALTYQSAAMSVTMSRAGVRPPRHGTRPLPRPPRQPRRQRPAQPRPLGAQTREPRHRQRAALGRPARRHRQTRTPQQPRHRHHAHRLHQHHHGQLLREHRTGVQPPVPAQDHDGRIDLPQPAPLQGSPRARPLEPQDARQHHRTQRLAQRYPRGKLLFRVDARAPYAGQTRSQHQTSPRVGPGGHQGALPHGVGDPPAQTNRDERSPRALRGPIPKHQRAHANPEREQARNLSYDYMEGGTQDEHVLPSPTAQTARHPVRRLPPRRPRLRHV